MKCYLNTAVQGGFDSCLGADDSTERHSRADPPSSESSNSDEPEIEKKKDKGKGKEKEKGESPAGTKGKLPTVPVKSGEQMNWGVGRYGVSHSRGTVLTDMCLAHMQA